jgi:transposase
MEFRELSDEEWELIKPLLPPKAKTGRPKADDRRVLNDILYVLATGCRCMDMPPKYGHYSTAFRRLKHWQTQGIWTRILKTLIAKGYTIGKLSIGKVSVDSTIIEAKKGEHF